MSQYSDYVLCLVDDSDRNLVRGQVYGGNYTDYTGGGTFTGNDDTRKRTEDGYGVYTTDISYGEYLPYLEVYTLHEKFFLAALAGCCAGPSRDVIGEARTVADAAIKERYDFQVYIYPKSVIPPD